MSDSPSTHVTQQFDYDAHPVEVVVRGTEQRPGTVVADRFAFLTGRPSVS